jgi:hypothetical protein
VYGFLFIHDLLKRFFTINTNVFENWHFYAPLAKKLKQDYKASAQQRKAMDKELSFK